MHDDRKSAVRAFYRLKQGETGEAGFPLFYYGRKKFAEGVSLKYQNNCLPVKKR